VAAVVLCAPATVDHSWVGGEPLVQNGMVVGVDLPALVASHNLLAMDLAG
jgi:hypothetical protein